jgi:hypothetical protein
MGLAALDKQTPIRVRLGGCLPSLPGIEQLHKHFYTLTGKVSLGLAIKSQNITDSSVLVSFGTVAEELHFPHIRSPLLIQVLRVDMGGHNLPYEESMRTQLQFLPDHALQTYRALFDHRGAGLFARSGSKLHLGKFIRALSRHGTAEIGCLELVSFGNIHHKSP